MKKTAVIFIIIFILTLTVPLLSLRQDSEKSKQSELVTIFSSNANLSTGYHSPFQDQP